MLMPATAVLLVLAVVLPQPTLAVTPPPNTRLVKDCRHGDFFVMWKDQYIGRSLEVQGEWGEGEVQQVFQRFIKAGDTVVDVGANIGAFTVPLAKLAGPTGIVHAVEPIRTLFNLMVTNTVINGLSNVQAHHAYAGSGQGGALEKDRGGDTDSSEKDEEDEDGSCSASDGMVPTFNIDVAYEPGNEFYQTMEKKGFLNFGSISVKSLENRYGTRNVDLVRTVSIDSLGLFACDFIKIDVEGAELDVLGGARKTLKQFKPVVFMEADRPDKNPVLLSFLEDQLGYSCVEHKVAVYNHANFRDADPWNAEVAWVRGREVVASHNVLCMHNEDDRSDELPAIKAEWARGFFGAPAHGEQPRKVSKLAV